MRRWMNRSIGCMIVVFMMLTGQCLAGEAIPLWPDGAPGASGKEAKDTPTLTPYPSRIGKEPRPAVLLCPGGGYKHISGADDLAKWFNSLGVSVYVLKYRLPVNGYLHPAPLQDAQKSMRLIRKHAAEWALDPTKIGVMGFSSGGHVASTLGTHFDVGDPKAANPVDRLSCRPDFMVLMCPVVTFGQYVHGPSKARLLGNAPSKELVDSLSNELQVKATTPPSFLAHCKDDGLVKPENSQLFHAALLKAGVKAELKLYEKGGHPCQMDGKYLWFTDCEKWLREMGVVTSAGK